MEDGIIIFGQPSENLTPNKLSAVSADHLGTNPFVAPYWIENDLSVGGDVSYAVFSGNSTTLIQVSNFISSHEGVNFSGTWMLVAKWDSVPLFGSSYKVSAVHHYGVSIQQFFK